MSAPGRLERTFAGCRDAGRAALVTYVMGGDPDVPTSAAMALACVAGGADLLEIGVPFSDPIADGPTIQRAAERALAHGTSLADCVALVAQVRGQTEVPIALMGYVNPVLAYGFPRFVADAVQAGVDAVILADLPPEEADDLCESSRHSGLRTVFLLAPTSTEARCRAAFARATGFVYFVAVTGVTGSRASLPDGLEQRLDEIRAASRVPLVVGFGIAEPEQAARLGRHADGVVVGSAIVARVAEGGRTDARADRVRQFVRAVRSALEP